MSLADDEKEYGHVQRGVTVWEVTAPLPHDYTPPQRVMTYAADNRLATFNGQAVSHDLDGNMTYGPLTNNSLVGYNYDARNRLVQVGGTGSTPSMGYHYL